ncbi:MAG: SusC/RagA family TonB-linked outer membrane protein [Chlorobi bacterium]|nr:SusC/RagA family TonB-linked outer membrane protein [Chlorobiota bacterium]
MSVSAANPGKPGVNTYDVQQPVRVTGKVTSSVDGKGLPGVTVLIKGTRNGTITGSDGGYTISVPGENSMLVFSFVGYETREEVVGNRRVINIELQESERALEQVVVTALGITRAEKSLGFSVGKVEGEDLTKVVQENVVSSLAGKVAGVTINATGGTGSSVSMVIRGATSLSSDNQPLFVVDGVPMINGLNNMTQIGDRNIVDYGNAISDINPDDIESISILKGPSAAALYGSRAGNGVVLITTKKGKRSNGVTVSVHSNTVFDRPYKYFETQKHFATGYFSFTPGDFPSGTVMTIDPAQAAGAGIECDKGYFAVQWQSPVDANGAKIPIEVVSYPDNVANFVRTGITTTNGVSITNKTDVMNYRIGVTNMSNSGIVPNSDLFRNNLSIGTDIKATEKITFSTNFNISNSWSNNRPSSNRGTNPLEWAYKVPLNINILDLKDYWEPGQEGVQQKTPAKGIYDNPYFLANEVHNSFNRDRIFGNLTAEWQVLPELSFRGRYSIDSYTEKRETKIAPSYSREPNNGAYGIVDIRNYERNADFLATFRKQITRFDVTVSAGGNTLYQKSSSIRNASRPTTGLVVPNVYTVNNIKSGSLDFSSSWSQRAIYSVYGMANLSYNNLIFLDLTARNDWSSTLPKENQSYFYPSASLSLLLNEMVNLGSKVDLLKLRGGWAKVGNDASPYQLYPTYGNVGQWGDATRLSKPGTILTPNLKPEEATSWEAGTEIRMFGDRFRFEGTYYEVDNRNQIIRNIPIATSSGFSSVNVNAGLIESRGWEFLIGGIPVKTSNLMWDINVNLSRNRTKLTRIAEGIDFIKFWSDAKGGAWTYAGDEIGDLYDAQIITVTDESSPYYGYPIIGGSDFEWQEIKSEDTKNKIGNYNPDFLLGLQTTLTYKGFMLSMTFDWRKGGQFVSQTYRYMAEDANSEDWIKNHVINPGGRTGKELRDWLVANEDEFIKNGFHVVGGPAADMGGLPESWSGIEVYDGTFVPGVVQNADGTYTENLGDNNPIPIVPYVVSYPWGFMRPSTFDADFIKLREISLSYHIPGKIVKKFGIQDVLVSVYSRNIMLWTKAKIGIDPERAFQAEASGFKQGIERYNVEPWVMPIGFKLNLTF